LPPGWPRPYRRLLHPDRRASPCTIKPPPPAALAPRMSAPETLVGEEPADLPQVADAPLPAPAPTPEPSGVIAEATEATRAEIAATVEEQKPTTRFDRCMVAAVYRAVRA